MPSWHVDCFSSLYGSYQKGFPAKYESPCKSGAACKYGGRIKLSESIVARSAGDMPRPFGGAPAIKQQEPQGVTIGDLIKSKLGGVDAILDSMVSEDLNAPEVTPDPADLVDPIDVKEMVEPGAVAMQPNVLEISQRILKLLAPILDTAVDDKVAKGLDPVKLAAGIKPILEGLVISEVSKLVRPNKMAEDITLKVLDKIAAFTTTTVEIKNMETGKVTNIGAQHKQFKLLLQCVQAKANTWLAGPSGSGKTTAAMNVAKALDKKFFYTGAVSDPYALLGYNNAQGVYVRTPFREAWENGGVFLWDEVDASDPNALVAFNALLANRNGAFPDGCIPQHKDCVMIAAANTWGHGATHEYVGRLKMDMAFLKRFAFLAWEYDEQMELDTAPNRVWTKRVQAVRRAVALKGMRVLVTPRESYIGADLLAVGIPQTTVEDMTIRSGMTQDQWNSVRYAS